jgi:HAD superfamily hydrolase (TIGR01509 family)
MNKSIYQNIIFDLFDVLVETQWNIAIPLALGTDAALTPLLLQFLDASKSWELFKKGLINYQQIEASLPPTLPATTLHKFTHETPLHAQPIQGMVELLRQLKQQNFRLYLLSNVTEPTYTILEQRFAFMQLFDGKLASFQAKALKPEPQIFQHFLTLHRLDPSTCFFIDDKKENIAVAEQLGIQGTVYIGYNELCQELKNKKIL